MIEIINIHYLISFGTVGILYNKQAYPNEDFSSWRTLYQPKYKNDVLLVDGAREIMGLALNKLGYSLNDTNPNHLKKKLRRTYIIWHLKFVVLLETRLQ